MREDKYTIEHMINRLCYKHPGIRIYRLTAKMIWVVSWPGVRVTSHDFREVIEQAFYSAFES